MNRPYKFHLIFSGSGKSKRGAKQRAALIAWKDIDKDVPYSLPDFNE